MNLYEYNPRSSIKMVLGFTGIWTLLWCIIIAVQTDPIQSSDWIIIFSVVMGFNAFVFYLHFLRNWQKLIINTDQIIISCDKRFFIPKVYKASLHDVYHIEFNVTAISIDLSRNSKQEEVLAFRSSVKDHLTQELKQASDVTSAMQGCHFNPKSPHRGVVEVTAIQLKNKSGDVVLHAQIPGKKELKKFLKFYKSPNLTWSWNVRWA